MPLLVKVEFNRRHAAPLMPYFQQEFFEMSRSRGGWDDALWVEVGRELGRLSRNDGLDKALVEHRLDAIIARTEGPPPFVIDPDCR